MRSPRDTDSARVGLRVPLRRDDGARPHCAQERRVAHRGDALHDLPGLRRHRHRRRRTRRVGRRERMAVRPRRTPRTGGGADPLHVRSS